jgi:predicted signal transduction protein with EAL and GGDEF domain
MITTAEGIETEEQLAHLASMDCVEGQGYLFSQPHPANEVAAMLQHLQWSDGWSDASSRTSIVNDSLSTQHANAEA